MRLLVSPYNRYWFMISIIVKMSKVPYDKLSNMTQPRMATEIGKIIERMNGYYGDLNGKQAEYMSMDPTAYLGLYVTHTCRCDVHVFGIYQVYITWCTVRTSEAVWQIEGECHQAFRQLHKGWCYAQQLHNA